MNPVKSASLDEKVRIGDYLISISQPKDMIVYDNGLLKPEHVRSVRVLATYENQTNTPIKSSLIHWVIFDEEGFSYDYEIRNQFYEKDKTQKLQSTVIGAGQRMKGWVAFQVPRTATPAYVQFRPSSLNTVAGNFYLPATKSPVGPIKQQTTQLPKQSWAAKLLPFLRRAKNELEELSYKPGIAHPYTTFCYKLQKPLIDFFENLFLPDTILTFSKRYPAYHGLHILEFEEAVLYLHTDQHKEILDNWQAYFTVEQQDESPAST
ncbi:MAG: DUF4352 domain-containing protein [Candidatus Promineifilaceae bacterium]